MHPSCQIRFKLTLAGDFNGADFGVLDGRDEPKGDLPLGVGGDILESLFDGLIGATSLLKDIKTSEGLFTVDQDIEDLFPLVLHGRLRGNNRTSPFDSRWSLRGM